MEITALQLARRFTGLSETAGSIHNTSILAMLKLVDRSVQTDETAWCGAFVNYVAWLLDLQRANSLSARAWLRVGTPVELPDARPGFDVVVLSRGAWRPGAQTLAAPGHVGFYAGHLGDPARVRVFGGNQRDQVCFEDFLSSQVLGIRRLAPLAAVDAIPPSPRPV